MRRISRLPPARTRRQATMSTGFGQVYAAAGSGAEDRGEGSAGRETQEVRRSLGHRGRKMSNVSAPQTVNAAVTRTVIDIPSQVLRRARRLCGALTEKSASPRLT